MSGRVHRRCGKPHGPTIHRYAAAGFSARRERFRVDRKADRRAAGVRFASSRWCPAVNPRTNGGAAGLHVAPNGRVTFGGS
jgi:hypothetical protein